LLEVELWAELRREHFVRGVSIKKLVRRTGLSRNTIRKALRSDEPPAYRREPAGSMLDPFRDEIHGLLKDDSTLPGVRVLEELERLGFGGGITVVNDYLREVRPFYLPPRTFQRTVYRPGEICQWDLWRPSREIPVGHGQTRVGYVVIAALGYSRVGSGALIFSKEAVDILWGMARCVRFFGAVPRTLVWDREGAMHAGGGRPSEELAGFCGQLRCGWQILDPGDCQAKGVVERLQGYAETNFEPGRSFANPLDFQLQLDRWFEKANARTHRTLRCRPIDRLADDVRAMIAPPERWPESDRRWVVRVPVDPYVRFDTNDYSLDPRFAGRRVEVRVSQAELTAVALDSGELVARHQRSFARHRAITALEHARALRQLRGQPAEPEVEQRPAARYDAVIGG
jgi:transposase